MPQRPTLLRCLSAALIIIGITSCGGGAPTDLRTSIRRVEVISPRPAFVVGKAITLTARAYDAAGEVISTEFEWGSTNTSIISVSPTGVAQAVSSGSAGITAKANGVTGAVSLATIASGPSTVTASTPSSQMTAGDSFQSVLTVRDFDGDPIAPVLSNYRWSSSDTLVAVVSTTGLVTARRQGFTRIALLQAVSLSPVFIFDLNVRAPTPVSVGVTLSSAAAPLTVGDTTIAEATLRDSAGRALTGFFPTWTSSDPTVARVTSSGVVTALRSGGPVAITAAVGVLRGSAQLTVLPQRVTSITLSLTNATRIQDSSVTITGILRDARGAVVSDREISWSTSAPGIATVSVSGVVTAIGPGGATITAAVDDARATATITVLPRVASITVTPARKMLGRGLPLTFVATLRDASGAVLTGRSVEWRSPNGRIVSIDPNGTASAFSPGTVTISAAREGVVGTASVTSYQTVAIISQASEYRVGLAYKVSALFSDSTGATSPIVGDIGWGTSGVAIVSYLRAFTTDIILALTSGSAEFGASVGVLSGSLPINVLPDNRNICGRAAGSILLSGDATPVFLGNISAPSDPLSIFNPTGIHGSATGALSINNPAGRYGSAISAFSARDPDATNPPFMSRANTAPLFVTIRSDDVLGTTPQYLATCSLP